MMLKPFLLMSAMIFLGIVDDFYLQGILAKLKQKEWWEKNAPDKLYEDDYIVALVRHAFSWSFLMSSPLLILSILYNSNGLMCVLAISYILNTLLHAVIDNAKANRKKISLFIDQSLHLFQILWLWLISLVFIPI